MIRFIKRFFELRGIDEIASYAEMQTCDVMDLITHYDGFPAHRENSIWIARRGPVRRWLKANKIKKPEPVYYLEQPTIKKTRSVRRRKRW